MKEILFAERGWVGDQPQRVNPGLGLQLFTLVRSRGLRLACDPAALRVHR